MTIFLASAFLGTIRNGATKADGVPLEWVGLVLVGSCFSVAFYVSSAVDVASRHGV